MKSFDSKTFVDGGELFSFYNKIWTKESEKLKDQNSNSTSKRQNTLFQWNKKTSREVSCLV
jgi:hypothetical protein